MYQDCEIAAKEIIEAGTDIHDLPLSPALKAYLIKTISRYFNEQIDIDCLTIRYQQASRSERKEIAFQYLADECLMATSLFMNRIERTGSISYYMKLGSSSYGWARLTEQAYAFAHMRDVIMIGTNTKYYCRPMGKILIQESR